MTHQEIIEIELKVVTVARWIGRAIGFVCICLVAGYLWGKWV